MKITITRLTETGRVNNNYQDFVEISIERGPTLFFADGEPEDNNMSRNFNDIYKIGSLLGEMYKAGELDEGFELNEIEVDEM